MAAKVNVLIGANIGIQLNKKFITMYLLLTNCVAGATVWYCCRE